MTEPLLPDDMANGLVDGTAGIEALPVEFHGVADVLAAAHQPPTVDELAGMASAVAAFTAAAAAPVSSITPDPARSRLHMLSARIPRRAAVIVTATLLTAGTAAAAAGGVISVPFAGSHYENGRPFRTTTTSSTSTTTTMVGDTTTTSSTEPDQSTTTESTDVTETSVPTTVDGRTFGHCTAWTHGHRKTTDNPGFHHLQDEADALGVDVDTYCQMVLDGSVVVTDTSEPDQSSTSVDTTEPSMPTNPGRGNGRGNGGSTNPGMGHVAP